MIAKLLSPLKEPPVFSLLELGAMPDGPPERFVKLCEDFPGSRLISVEPGPEVCRQLNETARPGQRFCPAFIGRKKETRPFYVTNHSICSSLFKPNEPFLNQFTNLKISLTKSVIEVETIGLDEFAEQENIGPVDFIKADIQGAECEAFTGGREVLKDVVFIVTEVLFSPLHLDVPLFGDVCRCLTEQGFQFYRFTHEPCGRTLDKITINDNKNYASAHLWGDAVFVRDVSAWDDLTAIQILKLAVFAALYEIADVAGLCFWRYDQCAGTNQAQEYYQSQRRMMAWS